MGRKEITMTPQISKKHTGEGESLEHSREHVVPRYDVEKHDHTYEVRVYLPGVAKGDASITIDQDSLIVEASRQSHWDENWRSVHREIPIADYRLQLELNVHVNEDAIRANSEEGVLTIHLPVAEEARPRTIKVH